MPPTPTTMPFQAGEGGRPPHQEIEEERDRQSVAPPAASGSRRSGGRPGEETSTETVRHWKIELRHCHCSRHLRVDGWFISSPNSLQTGRNGDGVLLFFFLPIYRHRGSAWSWSES